MSAGEAGDVGPARQRTVRAVPCATQGARVPVSAAVYPAPRYGWESARARKQQNGPFAAVSGAMALAVLGRAASAAHGNTEDIFIAARIIFAVFFHTYYGPLGGRHIIHHDIREEKEMRKKLALLLAMAICLSSAACSGGNQAVTPVQDEQEAGEIPSVDDTDDHV